MDKTHTVAVPPKVPSKFDVIPIHASDISAYKRCRRYWDWTSPTRNNLRRKVQIYGVNTDLWFGTGIHYALEMYYNPLIQRDPVEAFSTWWHLQWNGGEVEEEWLDRSYDLNPKLLDSHSVKVNVGSMTAIQDSQPIYFVQGLKDLLPDPIPEEFEGLRDLGIGMLEFYKDYAQKNDDFRVIAAESQFSIPLGFEAVDIREDSPNFGKELPVHARGKRDTIIQSLRTMQYGLIDYKTKTRIDDDYFESLNKDEQVTNYMTFSQEEAAIHDLPWTTISFCMHQAMRKVFPKPPTMTQKGLPSLDKQSESTTAEMFAEFIAENGLQPWYDNTPKAQGYYEYLLEQGDENFVVRTPTYRNKYELANQFQHVQVVAHEMLSDPAIYPSPNAGFLCVHCQFRGPCIAADDGSGSLDMIESGYETNINR